MRTLALALLVTGLAACGNETTPSSPAPATNLLVRVDPDGHGSAAAKTARVRCPGSGCAVTGKLAARDFAPHRRPARRARMIYGGPETATVRGSLRGSRDRARASRAPTAARRADGRRSSAS